MVWLGERTLIPRVRYDGWFSMGTDVEVCRGECVHVHLRKNRTHSRLYIDNNQKVTLNDQSQREWKRTRT